MTINENLRNLRLAANMTQAQAADAVGMTRQGLSSYETGRTHPDIETLKRLAQLYGTDLDGILYGQSKAARSYQTLKIIGTVLYAIFAVLTLASSAFLWTANYYFELPVGPMTETTARIFKIREHLIGTSDLIDQIILNLAFIGLLFLLIYCAVKNHRYHLRYRIAWAAVCAASILSIGFVFSAADPVFSAVNYLITPLLVSGRLLIFLILDFLIQKIQNRKQRKEKRNA